MTSGDSDAPLSSLPLCSGTLVCLNKFSCALNSSEEQIQVKKQIFFELFFREIRSPHLSVQCSPSTLHAELLLTASEIHPDLSDLYSAWPQFFFLPASKLVVIPNALCLLKRIAKDAGNKFIFSYLRNSPDSQNCRVATSPCWRQESLLHLGHFWKSGHRPGDLNGNAGEQHLIPLLKVLTA